MAVSLESNQIFRISMAVVEDDEHAGCSQFVHDTVVHLNGAAALGWRCDHVLLSGGVIPRQHSTEVHALLPSLIWLGVGVMG